MKTLIILRPEIFSVLIMVFLIMYDRYCAKYRNEKETYFKFALVCLAHCVFALITEITVNMDRIPTIINDICHILFFLFSLLYSLFYFEYALGLIMPVSKRKNRIMAAGYVISIICVIIMLVSPIEYIQGQNTRYSAGIGPTLCYALGFLLFIAADVIMIVNHKHINCGIIMVLIPLSFIALGLLTVQIIFPEFLYTAQALTITALGLFFAIENPVEKFKDRAFIDSNVQTWNRNCYEYDLGHIVVEKLHKGERLTIVIGDVNGLKRVNDTLGHIDGDKLLEAVAEAWHEKMGSVFKYYRVGGDEFVALYFNESSDTVKKEISEVEQACDSIKMDKGVLVGMSMGYAEMSDGENVNDTFKRAEAMMYKNKKMYYENNGINRRID